MIRKNLHTIKKNKFDLIIIGGGITGACLAWDASLRGLKVLLLEKKDFAHATSSATSKLIHGGLRYLKNMELSLVRESLRERRYMQIISPHMVYPMGFYVPFKGWKMAGPIVMTFGMLLYHLLSFDRNKLPKGILRIPFFKLFSNSRLKKKNLLINYNETKGGLLYFDCQVYSPQRHTLDFIKGACENGAEIRNYSEVTQIIYQDKKITGVKVRDNFTKETALIEAPVVINAGGAWADLVLNTLPGKVAPELTRSQGIHLIIDKKIDYHGVGVQLSKSKHIFIIPWKGKNLIGTTDSKYSGHPDDYHVSKDDIDSFIADINLAFPELELNFSDVIHFYGGLRPLVETDATSSYNASRKYDIIDHKEEGYAGLLTVEGGKYTTSRSLADDVLKRVYFNLGRKAPKCLTHFTPTIGGEITSFDHLMLVTREEFSYLDDDIIEHLCRCYGARVKDLLNETNRSTHRRVVKDKPEIIAQFYYAIDFEQALSLEDLIFRRTGLALAGNPGKAVLKEIAKLAGKKLKWSQAQINKELKNVEKLFKPK